MIFNPLFVYMAPTSGAGELLRIVSAVFIRLRRSFLESARGARWGKLNPRKFLLVNMALLGALTLMVLATSTLYCC